MIIIGQATVNSNTGLIELRAPMGFGTARGVRLSNYCATAIELFNMSGVEQDTQYLMPNTQMVYHSTNVGRVPTGNAIALNNTTVAANLLVEWSTDPERDFIGTYPAALPAYTAPPTFYSNYLGAAISAGNNTLQNIDVSSYKTLRLYLTNGSTSGANFNVQWFHTNTGGLTSNTQKLSLIGGGSAPGPNSGYVDLPVMGQTVTVFASTSGGVIYGFGLSDATDKVRGVWDGISSIGPGHATAPAVATNLILLNVFGPAWFDFTATVHDTSTKGYFYLRSISDTSGVNIASGFLDVVEMVNSGGTRGLVAHGRIAVGAGLDYVGFAQDSATTGGLVSIAGVLTPI